MAVEQSLENAARRMVAHLNAMRFQLEARIEDMLRDFTEETGLEVTSIDLRARRLNVNLALQGYVVNIATELPRSTGDGDPRPPAAALETK